MLYRPSSVFGTLISVKTWHRISHVEVYDGDKNSLASRDGQGVARYPVRLDHLAYVLRATQRLDLTKGRAYFESLKGTPYGWWDLLNFVGAPVNAKGIVCSPFAAGYLRAAGWNVFPEDPIEKVAPFQFLDLVGKACVVVYEADTAHLTA